MPQTKVQVVSSALNLLGKKSTLSLVNQDDFVNTASEQFDKLFSAEFETATWRFATTIVQLNRLNMTPLGGYYTYAYQLPANYKKLIHLWPLQYDFEIYTGKHLYSNYNDAQSPLFLEYQFLPVIGDVPDSFWEYFSIRIAEKLAMSNAQTLEYKQVLSQDRVAAHGIALAADAQNRPNTPIQNAPMITRRFVSTFVNG